MGGVSDLPADRAWTMAGSQRWLTQGTGNARLRLGFPRRRAAYFLRRSAPGRPVPLNRRRTDLGTAQHLARRLPAQGCHRTDRGRPLVPYSASIHIGRPTLALSVGTAPPLPGELAR